VRIIEDTRTIVNADPNSWIQTIELADLTGVTGCKIHIGMSPDQREDVERRIDWRILAPTEILAAYKIPIIGEPILRTERIGQNIDREFQQILRDARDGNYALIDIEPTRFARDFEPLAKHSEGVKLITLLPYYAEESYRHSQVIKFSKRWIEKIDGEDFNWGRPVDLASHNALPFILSNLGQLSFRKMAKALGADWSDKKIVRVLDRLFPYRPLKA
jgi:hypothetical protein